ncbi:MAG: M48 family metallopeptidase [Sinobacteraceae bacterium]|nr:M48 family metallopeptidase [Nevskiaceae bacterium]
MNFYERQSAARRSSRWLLLAFATAVLLVVAVLSWAVLLALGFDDPRSVAQLARDEPGLAVSAALFWLLVIMGASTWRSLSLRDGGGVVAQGLGGTRVDRTTGDPDLRRLRNVVEEMAIASGVPVPEIYVLDRENAINAFAAGHSPANAAIAVTRGALMRLDREELQGVIAHEFSHILNGDTRLNLRLIGWLFGLLAVALLGRMLVRVSSGADRRRGAPPLLVIGAALYVVGSLGRGLGRLIQAAVSRQRERLADASAVQFTRNPGGLKGALLKIAALPVAGRLATARVDEVAHMLFVPGLATLFATHPSLAERVVSLDPSIRPERLEAVAAAHQRAWERSRPPEPAPPPGEVGDVARRLEALLVPAVATAVADSVGSPDSIQIGQAEALRLALPAAFTAATESPERSRALLLATLQSHVPAEASAQRAAIAAALGDDVAAAADAAGEIAGALPRLLRLPAVCELFPALRRLPRTERARLAGLIQRLAAVDHEIDVYEFCLQRLTYNSLVDQLEAREGHGASPLATSFAAIGILFSVLASRGESVDPATAFAAGVAHALPGPRRPPLQVPQDWPRRLWTALSRLERLHPQAKRTLVEALVITISHDQQLTVAEAELLRTVCAVLRCPLPLLLPRVLPPELAAR